MFRTRHGLRTTAPAARILLAAWILLAATGVVVCGDAPARAPGADPAIQAAIEQAVTAIAVQDAAAPERIRALEDLAAGKRAALLSQLALYLEKSAGTERSMAGALLLRQLAFTPGEILDTVVPDLDGARPALRRVLTEILGTIDRREGGEADFRVYDAWLAGRGTRPPAALVDYLYEVSPDEAVLCMRRVYGGGAPSRPESEGALDEMKRLMTARDASRSWSAKELQGATAALERLSRDPAWWVRRYAAAVVRISSELAEPPLVERLKGDTDPLVRRAF